MRRVATNLVKNLVVKEWQSLAHVFVNFIGTSLNPTLDMHHPNVPLVISIFLKREGVNCLKAPNGNSY